MYEIENEGQQLTVRRASKLLANNIARYEESGCRKEKGGVGMGKGKKRSLSLVVDSHFLPVFFNQLSRANKKETHSCDV